MPDRQLTCWWSSTGNQIYDAGYTWLIKVKLSTINLGMKIVFSFFIKKSARTENMTYDTTLIM